MALNYDSTEAFVSRVRVAGAAAGPLAGLTFAVKDLIDVAGVPTGGGNPDWGGGGPAPCGHAGAACGGGGGAAGRGSLGHREDGDGRGVAGDPWARTRSTARR